MSPRELAAWALGVRSSQIQRAEPIKHGLTNESWLVETACEAVVVRISSRHGPSLQIDRVSEAIVLESTAAAGISPPVLICDPRRGVLVTRYLGATCTPQQMADAHYIERLGGVFRTLHSLPVPPGIRAVHLPALIEGYVHTLERLRRDTTLIDPALRARGVQTARDIAASCAPRLCHNDVHHLNVIDGETLTLIDWEYAGCGEPYFDLASVCVYHEYTPDQRAQLLEAYQGSSRAGDRERLATCCWLFEYVRALWAQVRAAVDEPG